MISQTIDYDTPTDVKRSLTFRLALGEHIGVIPKTHQTNVFEARMIRLSFFCVL